MPNQEIFANALKRLQSRFPDIPDPQEHPVQFLLELHRLWKEGGGKLSGKPRHSDRFLR